MRLCFSSREVHQQELQKEFSVSQNQVYSPKLQDLTALWLQSLAFLPLLCRGGPLIILIMPHHFIPTGRQQPIPVPSVMLIFSWPGILLPHLISLLLSLIWHKHMRTNCPADLLGMISVGLSAHCHTALHYYLHLVHAAPKQASLTLKLAKILTGWTQAGVQEQGGVMMGKGCTLFSVWPSPCLPPALPGSSCSPVWPLVLPGSIPTLSRLKVRA